MKKVLEGRNWQCGRYAGYLYASPPMRSLGEGGRAYPAAFQRGDDEGYDGLPQRWVAIIEATNKREHEETMALI